MPTFAEWDAARKGGLAPSVSTTTPTDSEDTQFRPDMNASWISDSARYAGSEIKGIAHSPLDFLKGVAGLPQAVLSGAGELIKDPSLLMEVPHAAMDVLERPEELGSMLGQTVMGKAAPGVLKAGLESAPPVIGKTMSAVGRGSEVVGKSGPVRTLGALGGLAEMLRGDLKGTLLSAVPPALEYGGRALQSLGGKVSNADVMAGLYRAVSRLTPGEQFTPPTAADSMRTTVDTARQYRDAGASRAQANSRAGYTVKSSEVPLDRTALIDQPDLSTFQGPKAVASHLADLSTTRKSLGANPLAMREDIFNRAMTKLSKGELGRSPTPDIQDTLNELARKRYVSK